MKIKTNKIKINNKQVDINIPSHNIGIEYNGLYWHSERYKENDYHLNKTNDCEKEGIKLLHIFEDEWLNKTEIVKCLIKSNLNIFDFEINANNCTIKIVNEEISSQFLIKNNIFGDIKSEINIGLFYNSELVLLLCLNKNEMEFELLSYCNKLNINIDDGLGYLLRYVISNFKPNMITVQIDRRYSNGNIYIEQGFEFKGYTDPNYWCFILSGVGRHSRIKNELINVESNNNYSKIFDCGNIKFEMNLSY